MRHWVQTLLRTVSAHGVLLEFKPADTVGALLIQHLGELEQEADDKGGIPAVLASHFAKVYRMPLSLVA